MRHDLLVEGRVPGTADLLGSTPPAPDVVAVSPNVNAPIVRSAVTDPRDAMSIKRRRRTEAVSRVGIQSYRRCLGGGAVRQCGEDPLSHIFLPLNPRMQHTTIRGRRYGRTRRRSRLANGPTRSAPMPLQGRCRCESRVSGSKILRQSTATFIDPHVTHRVRIQEILNHRNINAMLNCLSQAAIESKHSFQVRTLTSGIAPLMMIQAATTRHNSIPGNSHIISYAFSTNIAPVGQERSASLRRSSATLEGLVTFAIC